jgi:hypothetical protein
MELISYKEKEDLIYRMWIKYGLQNLSFFFLGLATINLLWELVSRRNFTDEILDKVNLSHSIDKSGVIDIYHSFQEIDKENWNEILRDNVKFLHCFFSSSTVWFRNHLKQIEKINKKKRPIKIYMPNFNNDELLSALSIKDNESKDKIRDKLSNTYHKFLKMKELNPKFEIILVNKMPIMTFYMNESRIIIATYSIISKDENVPTFYINNEGFFYEFAKREIESLEAQKV